ncbi:MAG: MCE family protein [Planctomycetes bacterium]|nr:MCE family protein [Planctomycetota bacterium]
MTNKRNRNADIDQSPAAVPQAILKPARRLTWAWLVPSAALILAGWLAYSAWVSRGFIITVQLDQGHGIKTGHEVRYRGITVGEVRKVKLAEGFDGVIVTVSLATQADQLAHSGSRFWVVRPQLGLEGVQGLETLMGPRYLAVAPGLGALQRHFIGLNEPPVVETIEPGDLEIVLQATKRGGLRRGAPVTYRQVPVGAVLSVGLASDGGAVEARVHIEKAYAQLVREGTRFFSVGGLEADVSLTGVSLEVESLAALLTGGIALATPPDAGEIVRTGHRFVMDAQPPEDWLTWQPMAVIGNSMLPPGAPLPTPLRARIGWREGRWITRAKSRQGWVLQTDDGLLGPADLLGPNGDADRETVVLEVAGTVVELESEPSWQHGGLALLAEHVTPTSWPAQRRRSPSEVEDCLAVGDPTATPLPLAAARLTAQIGSWAVDPAVPVDESWHGAVVVARSDGFVVGLLLVDDDEARVALIPPSFAP